MSIGAHLIRPPSGSISRLDLQAFGKEVFELRVKVRGQTSVWLDYGQLSQIADEQSLVHIRHYAQFRLFIIDLRYS